MSASKYQIIELYTEVAVIGSGFGGAVAASRLVEQGKQVTMVERGPWRITLPTKSMNIRTGAELPRSNWWNLFRNSLASISDYRILAPRGQGINRTSGTFDLNNHPHFLSVCTSQVGGGSLNWCGAVSRPDKKDYWDNRALGLSEEVLAPHYDRVYKELGASVLGDGSEVPDNWERNWADKQELDFSANQTHSVAHRLPGRDANRETGWGITRAESEFRGHMSFGCLDGSKASTDVIYVAPALVGGMTLLAGCEARKIESKPSGGYCIHVNRVGTSVRIVIHCEKLVIGAGTYHTLRLLFEAQAAGGLAPMPALGNGISANGDEPAFLWNVKVTSQSGPRRGLLSMFHLKNGRRDLTHGFIEADLPETRWRLLRNVVKRLNNTLLLVSMGVDSSDGTTSFTKNRLRIDFDPVKNEINQVGRAEHRQISRLLGLKILFLPKRLTLHLSGGARVGISKEQGVVSGLGEVHNNSSLYVVDASVFPEAPGGPPALNIAAWASHVATAMYPSNPEDNVAPPVRLSNIKVDAYRATELPMVFACLQKPSALEGVNLRHLPGIWYAQPLASIKRWRLAPGKAVRAFTFQVRQSLPSLDTLRPDDALRDSFSVVAAWDGSGLAWQWSGREGNDFVEIQSRDLVNGEGTLACVYRNHTKEGWFKLNRT